MCILSSYLNTAGLAAARMLDGSEFHAASPAGEKARSPNLVLSRGVMYLLLEADRRPVVRVAALLDVWMMSLYPGHLPVYILYMFVHSLNVTLHIWSAITHVKSNTPSWEIDMMLQLGLRSFSSGRLIRNDMPVAINRSNWNWKKNSNMAAICFHQLEVVGLWYLIEVWLSNRFRLSEHDDCRPGVIR